MPHTIPWNVWALSIRLYWSESDISRVYQAAWVSRMIFLAGTAAAVISGQEGVIIGRGGMSKSFLFLHESAQFLPQDWR